VPCKKTVFELSVQMYHQNNVGPMGDGVIALVGDGVMLVLYNDKPIVEKHVEALIYDTGNFLAQAGGNLGLFLGFSCLSLLFAFINFLKKALKKKFES